MESFPVSFSHAAFFASTPSPHPQPPPRPPPGVLRRRGRGGFPRGGKGRAPSRRVPGGERSGEVGTRGRGGVGPSAAAQKRREREPTSHTFSGENQYRGKQGEEKRRERRSPGLRGGGECLAARRSGGGGPPCVTFNRSLLCQRQQRQEGLATESRETVISCVESSRQSESFLGLSLLSGLVYVHACVCVSACLSARRSRPRAVHPKHRHPSSP